MDHILQMSNYTNIPIIRLKDFTMGERMTNHVLSQILNYQLDLQRYIDSQKKRLWLNDKEPPLNNNLTVGILGLGFLGFKSKFSNYTGIFVITILILEV